MTLNTGKLLLIIVAGLIISLLPVPAGLTRDAWIFFALFIGVMIGLVTEPMPAAYIALLGVAVACVLRIGPADPAGEVSSAKAIAWGLSGFANTTVWLIVIAFHFALGYERTGLGRRISLFLVSRLGKSTLGLGYAIALSDLVLAPFIPSNTARSGGTIFPIVRNIPLLYGSSPEKEPRKIGAYISWVALASTCVTSSMFYTALATNVLAKSLVQGSGMMAPTWTEWVFYFLPAGILLLVSVPLVTYFVYPPTLKRSTSIPEWAGKELKEMGGISRGEVFMTIFAVLAILLWILGKYLGIHATLAALIVLCLMVLFRVISWRDVLENRAGWNVFLWFGALVTLAGGLNNTGFLDWLSGRITSGISSYSPRVIMIILLLVFYFIHYLFASSTAHATALLTIFIMAGSNIAGTDMTLLTLLLLYSLGLMGILTPYATGPSPIWYGLGYIPSRTFWGLGALFGIYFIAVLILVGIPWIRLWM